MRRLFRFRNERPLIVVPDDKALTHGCLPVDEFAEKCFDKLAEESVTFSAAWDDPTARVIRFGDDFVAWRKSEIEANDTLRESGHSILPWDVARAFGIAFSSVYYTQGARPSCMGHADAFAWHSMLLSAIGRGDPLVYEPINAMYTWAISLGGRINTGQSVAEMADAACKVGHFPIKIIGGDNQNYSKSKADAALESAKKYQSSVLFLPQKNADLANEIIQSCRAGLAVSFGNSTAVSGSEIDGNGVKIARIRGTWAHATHFAGYRTVNGDEYIGWINSHGARYKSSDEGEPADMCWMTRSQVEAMCATMARYGAPYIVFAESQIKSNRSILPAKLIPFAENFRLR